MWTDFHLMDVMDEMRSAVGVSLPKEAFLRRDRSGGLFVSNAPVFTPEISEIPGFHAERIDKLIRIRPDESWLRKLEEDYPEAPDDFCRSLMRFRHDAISAEAMALFCAGLKLIDAGEGALPGEIVLFDRNVRQLAARALRKDISGGGLYGLSLLDAMLKK